MMVVKYALRFSLSHVAVTNLFAMINCMFSTSILPDTRYLVDKMFFPRDIATLHSICPQCDAYVGTYDYHDLTKTCAECNLVIQLKDSNNVNFFVTYSISNEIKTLVEENDEYYDNIVNRRTHDAGIYKDIYDGQAYRKFVENLNPSERKSYITLTFNTDGAPVFESSSYSIWPIQIVVNEIPLHIRSSKTILFAFWFGKKKPNMSVFLHAFVEEINQLTESGISCNICGEEKLIRPYALVCCVDTIARAPVQGVRQFNAHDACNWCLHRGEWIANSSETRGSMKYPIITPLPEERTMDNMLVFAEDLVVNNQPVAGLNRVTPLINLHHFDIIYGFVPDDMHFLRLGIGKQFTNYYLSVLSSSDLDKIDKLLNNFQAPKQVMRLSRQIRDRSYWKAKEWENWILFYSTPILSLFLKQEYVLHWAQLVEIFHISLQPVITRSDLKRMHELILEFLFLCEKHFSKEVFTYNLHQLLHWLRSVVDWGPPWAHTGFVFEAGNGKLLKKIILPKVYQIRLVDLWQWSGITPF